MSKKTFWEKDKNKICEWGFKILISQSAADTVDTPFADDDDDISVVDPERPQELFF